jgi:hypothetical protein
VHLVACVPDDDGGSSSSGVSATESTSSVASSVDVGGSVGDGPVTGATVEIYNKNDQLISSAVSDTTASFKSRVKAKGKNYPLVLEVVGGVDLVTGMEPDFQMLSVMLNPSNKQVNINPHSTLIVMMAEYMSGGLNSANVDTAKSIVLDKLGFGFDTNVMPDPITTPVTELNVANLVKSSEALGEMVRRTRDQLTAAGTVISGDGVMQAIAADMTDGYLDGVGAADASPAIAAVANVVSSQVLVEALSNNLRVGGMIATAIIDQAIAITRSQILSSQLTDSVRITSGMLKQARVALSAAQVIDTSAQVSEMASTVETINDDSLPEEITPVLPADSSILLDNAVVLSSIASEEDANAINEAVHMTDSTGDTGTVNTPPEISGNPAGSVTANAAYGFQPSASDADDDKLIFSISVMPVWADFDTDSGLLSGTPGDSHEGTTSNIVISVTDGTDKVSLPGFSITVDPAPAQTGDFDVSWTAPATRADGEPLSLADISGYRIYYGDTAGNYTDVAEVSDGAATSATVTDVPLGTCYIVMTTYDINDQESSQSMEISKLVQ